MKKSWADKWVKALRSGKYKQTTGRLNRIGNYCCLGVLCDISKLGTWVQPQNNIGWLEYKSTDEFDAAVFLPDSVQKLTGMYSICGSDNKSKLSLMDLNDEKKWSFKKIAAYIEKNYKNL